MRTAIAAMAWLILLQGAGTGQQTPARPDLARAIPRFGLEGGVLMARGPVRPWSYLGDQGRKAALFGDETGSFEAWIWPMKLVRELRLAFKLTENDEPIQGAVVAREVIARPEGATIVYSHPAFTVREHVIVPLNEPGVLVLLEVETVRSLSVLVRMDADFNLAWPGSAGGGYITWLPDRHRFLISQSGVGSYNAFIGSPFATDGATQAVNEASTIPTQFRLRFDPATVGADYIPIVIAGAPTSRDSVELIYNRLLERAPVYWREKLDHYRSVRQEQLGINSPDAELDQAFEWAKVNLDQQLVCNPDLGCGLVAGFGRAGAGDFRGAGWFFGGDAAINSTAMSAIGQFSRVNDGLRFLARYQRADGKIAHEISQAAGRLPWFTDYPNAWLHGETTPFWIMACYSYWTASGDDAFLKQLWPNIARAFRWSASTDSDGDGLMENAKAGASAIAASGLGESLGTDIYLAGVWVAALDGLREMARAAGDLGVASDAAVLFEKAHESLESRFWLDAPGIYAFALLEPRPESPGPRLSDALTVWPASAMSFGLLDDARAMRMLRELGSSAITADWGARMLSRYHPLYDPLHSNNGTVWPFASGFAALAHYRYHRGWAGFDLVRDVARATFDFARGRTPEVLSGAFYNVLDTAVPKQFVATSMLVSPLVTGLIGMEVDAPNRALLLEPHLPAEWNTLEVNNMHVGAHRVSMTIRRGNGKYEISLRRSGPALPLFVRLSPALPLGTRVVRASVNDRDVTLHAEESVHDVHAMVELTLAAAAEIEIEYDGGLEVNSPTESLEIGDRSSALKVLDFYRSGQDYVLLIEGVPGASYALGLRAESRVRSVTGAEIVEQANQRLQLRVRFGAGSTPFARREIRLRI